MSPSHHQLHRIEAGLVQSDPQLAATLGVFGRLAAGEAMPAWEQVPTRRDRIRQAAALAVKAAIVAAEAIGLMLSAILTLLIVLVRGSHPRSPARRRDQAGPGHVGA